MAHLWAAPPHDLAELEARAAWLAGRSLAELESLLGAATLGPMLRRKGKTGELIERALGATAGNHQGPDFAALGVELKTIPVDAQGRPVESTFVCSLSLAGADRLEWAASPLREKLAHVLWVPIIEAEERRIGEPLFWRPTPAQAAVLRADFDDIVGLIALGRIESLTAHVGRWLQARPKAAHSRVRTLAYDEDGEPLRALPRGFYLRARFTRALLRDPTTLAGTD
jgi:DNA mismatch repair protein MutH